VCQLMPKQKRLISIAWKEVEGFIHDWQTNPYLWEKERDIQVELTSRIKAAYKKKKMDTVWGKYTRWVDPAFWEKGQFYNRVCCEPLVYYEYKKGKRDVCRPDIVVWDDIKNPKNPDQDDRSKINSGILWACEIKFFRSWGKEVDDKKDWDLGKLRHLLKQSDGVKYACWLDIKRKRPVPGRRGLTLYKQGRLRKYCVTLPSLAK